MTITAHIVEDSINPQGKRITTLVLTYPRFIHSEFMTHRVFSRNAMSSRAVPTKKLLKQIRTNPAKTVHWGANQPGMQADNQLRGWRKTTVVGAWHLGGKLASYMAWVAWKAGAHKQVVNRIVEPWMNMVTVVTATEWENFFELRDHPDAEPNICRLAKSIKLAMNINPPKQLDYGEWHLPFVTELERKHHSLADSIKASVARCARVSYLNHDGTNPSITKDWQLYDRLVGAKPWHASPLEHQATHMAPGLEDLSGNFEGWIQYRKLFENNHQTPFKILGAIQ